MNSWSLVNTPSHRWFKIEHKTSNSSHIVSINAANVVVDSSSSHDTNSSFILAKGDSAASGHFFRPDDAHVLVDVEQECDVKVTLPDNDVIGSSHTGQLPNLPNLPLLATQASVLPRLASSSLVSLPQLCDHGCQCLLTKDKLTVVKNGNFILQDGIGIPVMTGVRNQHDRLWDIPFQKQTPVINTINHTTSNPFHVDHISPANLTSIIKFFQQKEAPSSNPISSFPPPNKKMNVIIRKRQLKQDLARFLHGALFSPRHSTLIKAIKNNFLSTFPGLTESLVKKHLPVSLATEMGHLKQERQHLQSTSITLPPDADHFPLQEQKTNDIICALTTYSEKEVAAADLTGRFPYRSSRGNQYVMVMYHYDSNVIWGVPLQKRTAADIVDAWESLIKKFVKGGFKPNLFIFDNEFSGEFRAVVENKNITLQLVTPHMHRNNPAERAIQTWKDHFLTGLASTHPDFPMHEWDRLIQQANVSLNLLRASRVHPQLSAYTSLFGNFNYNRTPIAPPGTKVVYHNKPSNRPSWGFHGEQGWYIGPALDHYRNIMVYFPKTRAERPTDTVTFLPHFISIPSISMQDHLLQAVDDIVSL